MIIKYFALYLLLFTSRSFELSHTHDSHKEKALQHPAGATLRFKMIMIEMRTSADKLEKNFSKTLKGELYSRTTMNLQTRYQSLYKNILIVIHATIIELYCQY